jgi:hypothetical protein
MKKIILFLSILFIFVQNLICFGRGHNDYFVLSPGLKFGYAIGARGGFVIGLELTIGRLMSFNSSPVFYGVVANLDFINDNKRLTVAGEYQSWPAPGLTFGPGLLFMDNSTEIGLIAGTYLSVGFLSLSYNYSIFKQSNTRSDSLPKIIDYHDIVIQIKYPKTYPDFSIDF